MAGRCILECVAKFIATITSHVIDPRTQQGKYAASPKNGTPN
ncbi:hypothetical protein CES86_1829 [Brucella lupini]|uniref:Uncharacterized protein n=1 Tax=Brucella lupini TaxID=255457 RepID=A0A256GTH9_9HYPH|nr:hypothetical protein CES86_1829 [Brucella lupini]